MTGMAANSVEKPGLHKRPHHLPNMKVMDTNCTMYNTEVPDFGEFLMKETFADVHLVCKGHKIPAHRSRLSSVSPFLAAVFAGDTSEVSVVIVPDVRYEALRLLVHFLYTGFMRATENEVREILEAGHTLGIDRAIDVERDTSFSVVEPGRSRKRQATEPLEMERKKKTARQSTVFIINAGEYVNSETGSFYHPGDDPLNIPDVYCSTLVTQAQHSAGSKEQTGKDQSSRPSLGHQSRMPMAEYQLPHPQDPTPKMTLDSGKTPGMCLSSESHAPEDQHLAMPPAPETLGQQMQQKEEQLQQVTGTTQSLDVSSQDLVSNQVPSNQDKVVETETSSSISCLPSQPILPTSQSQAQREISVAREVPTSSQLGNATRQSQGNIIQSPQQQLNSAQSQCQLSRSPVNQEESQSTQNMPGILVEPPTCASLDQPVTLQDQCQQNRNQENLLASMQQSSLPQRKDSSTPRAENQEVQIKREAINQNFVPPLEQEASARKTNVFRESTNPSLLEPQHSSSNVSHQTIKPAGLKQTVQQAVAGLLQWKNSQLKHGSQANLGKQLPQIPQTTEVAEVNQQQSVPTAADLQHPTTPTKLTANQQQSFSPERVCQEPMTGGSQSEKLKQNLMRNQQQVSQLAELGLKPVAAEQQTLTATESVQSPSTGLYQGFQLAELGQKSTPIQQQSPPAVKLSPKPMTINPQIQQSLLLQFQKHKLAMQTQKPSTATSSPGWTLAEKATLERAVSEELSRSPEPSSQTQNSPSRTEDKE